MKLVGVAVLLCALSSLASGAPNKASSPYAALLHSFAKSGLCPDGDKECTAGCCPYANWVCCPDDKYCANDLANCPTRLALHDATAPLAPFISKSGLCPDGDKECTAGCCPYANWVCCPDDKYCANDLANCPTAVATTEIKAPLAPFLLKSGLCPDGDKECTAGCCPYANWVCCPDDKYCANDLANCPTAQTASKKDSHISNKVDCDEVGGHMCGSGDSQWCCPNSSWECCAEDNSICAANPDDDCPKSKDGPTWRVLPGVIEPKKEQCDGHYCTDDDGSEWCCPYTDWVCCENAPAYCAMTPDECFTVGKGSYSFLKHLQRPSAASTQCPGPTCIPDDGGLEWCCPFENFICCPYGNYCQADVSTCPPFDPVKALRPAAVDTLSPYSLILRDECSDTGYTSCPAGCCAHESWVCCADNKHCASTANGCP